MQYMFTCLHRAGRAAGEAEHDAAEDLAAGASGTTVTQRDFDAFQGKKNSTHNIK